MTKDRYIKELVESKNITNKYMGRVALAIEKLNDSNILHHQAIDANTKSTVELTSAIKSQLSLFRWIVVALVSAIILLAGAEKVLKFIPSL